jgi:uncharacterized membrane protein
VRGTGEVDAAGTIERTSAEELVKVVLVAALLRDKLWAYPWMIGVLGVFVAFQLYRIALNPTGGLIALTVFDALIVALT